MPASTPKRWPDLILSKWPDFLEIYRDEETGIESFVFVVQRKNTRMFTSEQEAMLEALERAGLNVVVRFGSHDMTLAEYKVGGFNNSSLSKQAFYNARSDLKYWKETILPRLPENDPRRSDVILKIQRLEGKIHTNLPPTKEEEEADKILDKLATLTATTKLENNLDVLKKENSTLAEEVGVAQRDLAEIERAIPYLPASAKPEWEQKRKTAEDWYEEIKVRKRRFDEMNAEKLKELEGDKNG